MAETSVAPVFSFDMAGERENELREIAADIRRHHSAAMGHAIAIGKKLLAAKEMLPHGGFTAFIRDYCNYSAQTARRLMQVAEVFKAGIAHGERFDQSALYALAADSAPPAARIEAECRAANGEQITKSVAAEIVERNRSRATWPGTTEPMSDKAKADIATQEARIRNTLADLRAAGHDVKIEEITFEQLVRYATEQGYDHPVSEALWLMEHFQKSAPADRKDADAEAAGKHRADELSEEEKATLAECTARIKGGLAELHEAGKELKAEGVTFDHIVAFAKSHYGANEEDSRLLAQCFDDFMNGDAAAPTAPDIVSAWMDDIEADSVAQRLAAEYDVTPAQIRRDARYARAIEAIEASEGPEAKRLILSGKSGLSIQDVIDGKTLKDVKPVATR